MFKLLDLDFSQPGSLKYRRSVRLVVLYLCFAAILAVMSGVTIEFFIEWAREGGLYERPTERVGKATSAAWALLTNTYVLVLLAFISGLTLGLWGDILLRRESGVAPTIEESAPPQVTSSRERFRLNRRRLEEATIGASGLPAIAAYQKGSNLAALKISHNDVNYSIPVSPSSGTTVFMYDHDEPIRNVVALFDVKRGDLIDLRTLKAGRDTIGLSIGQRAIVFGKDGTAIQLLLTGVLDVGAGDDRDEAHFRYVIHSNDGDFLVPAL